MVDAWDACIHEDLTKVEDLMTNVIRSDNLELTDMCDYVLRVHGKRIRPAMCILCYLACGGKNVSEPIRVGAALEIIHNATLVHDDINDEAELRRGRKALYKEYSLSKSIVAGDFLFATGFQLIGSSSHKIVDYVVDAAASMGAGEFNQQDFEHKGKVSESDYMRIVNGKTAKFIECSAKCGSFLSGAEVEQIEALGYFANRLGIAFQIIDDTLDVIGDQNKTGKPIGNDILEGKPTLPTIYGMQDLVHGEAIRKIFEKNKPTMEEVLVAIELIKRTEAIEKCRSLAEDIAQDAINSLFKIEDSVYKDSLIALAYYIVKRDR
jgi:octaprenyl-diphosphate synthase